MFNFIRKLWGQRPAAASDCALVPGAVPQHPQPADSVAAGWLSITKPQLEAALLCWEQDHRNGKTRTYEETLALPAEQVAAESAEHLWAWLQLHATGLSPVPVVHLGKTYYPRQRHMGLPWILKSYASPPLRQVCPHCEQEGRQ